MPTTPAKYLTNPLPAGGFPLENEDLLTLQEVPRVALNAALAGLGTHYVLSGCVVDDLDPDISICYVTPGYLFIDGQVRYFAGNYGGTYPFYVMADTDSVSQKTFEDGNAKNAAVSLRTRIVTNRPTTGQFVTFNPNAVEKISTSITGALATALATEITDRQNADNALSATIGTKQTRVTVKIGWTDLQITNADYTTSDPNDFTGRDFNKMQYMRTEDGVVHLRGYVKNNGAAIGGYISGTLPPAIQPLKPVKFDKCYATSNLGITTNRFTISGSFLQHEAEFLTQPDVTNPAPQPYFWLDGISYSVE